MFNFPYYVVSPKAVTDVTGTCINWRKGGVVSDGKSTHVCKYQYEYGVTEGLGVVEPPVLDTVIPCCSHNISTR